MVDGSSARGLLGLTSICLNSIDIGYVLPGQKDVIRSPALLLNLQAYLLAQWAEHVGILQGGTNQEGSRYLSRDQYDAVRETLQEVLLLFDESKNLVTKYDGSDKLEPLPRLPSTLRKISQFTKLDRISTAVQWAVIDSVKFETLVRNIGKLVQRLFRLVPEDRELLKRHVHITLPEVQRLDLDILGQPGFSAGDENANDAVQSTIKFFSHSARIRSALPIWGVTQTLSNTGLWENPVKAPVFSNEVLPSSLDSWTTSLQVADGGWVPVMVEWRWTEQMAQASHEEQAIYKHDVARLAKLLSMASKWPEYRILPSLGYFVDDDYLHGQSGPRYGLLFQLPERTLDNFRSLHEAIARSTRQNRLPPSETRLHIAQELVSAAFYLLTVGWLHKAIHSRNLQLFGEPSSGSPSAPAVRLLGFEFSRPDELGQRSLDPNTDAFLDLYRHPECQSAARSTREYREQGYLKVYDIYSVGVLLFEIGCWRLVETVKQSLDDKRSQGVMTDENLQSCLVRRAKTDLAGFMGQKYAHVTHLCLAASCCLQDDSDGHHHGANIMTRFNNLVLQTLVSQGS